MKYVEIMRPIVKQAGIMIMDHFRQSIHIEQKKDKSIRTEVDLLVEKFLKDQLCAAISGSGFIAEESKNVDIQEYTWVIDPIDGTKNFVRGLPYFGISVALMHDLKIIAAMTYLPVMQECFYAELGKGSWRNGQRLILQNKGWMDSGVLIVVSSFRLQQVDIIDRLKQQLKSLDFGIRFRIFGAATLDLAYAAAGSLDIVIFENLKWWDAAAGILLVSEAGGWISQSDGSNVTQSFTSLIAGDSELCQLIVSKI